MTDRISVIGLGKLGASMAAALASRGCHVIGVDVDARAVSAINDGRAPVTETGLTELISANKERIRATTDFGEAIRDSDLSFVIVPTPSEKDGSFNLESLKSACTAIGAALKNKATYHNVVITSTVLPGSTREALIPILEDRSGKVAGRDFGVCYSPEFIALGSVINDFLNPDFTLIGEIDESAGSQLEALYKQVILNNAPSARMSLENAELTKIAVNTFVTTKITFANMLREMCERIEGGDIDVVTGALGLDNRIGRKYLTGALGYGGPCFPRDNVALSEVGQRLGVDTSLPSATDQANRRIPTTIVDQIAREVEAGSSIAILGLAYKPLSHVIEESQSIEIARLLLERGFSVSTFDPLAGHIDAELLPAGISIAASIRDCLHGTGAVAITTPDRTFASLKATDFVDCDENVAVFDLWRILRTELASQPGIRYFGSGLGRTQATGDQAKAAQND